VWSTPASPASAGGFGEAGSHLPGGVHDHRHIQAIPTRLSSPDDQFGEFGLRAGQTAIAGVVRDTTGAVLPGVTVEGSSPALIERVRTAVTDSQGQYKIIDLRPGIYSVTFTLQGFNSLRRDGIELTNTFTATVNADLQVGSQID
jgi:carboxypeptidase family protein